MIQQQLEAETIAPLPETLTSPEAKLVYLYVDAAGGATVDDLNETLAMQKMSILSVLNSLSGEKLVEKSGSRYVVSS
ncbi:MarR family transcriptional regulator [Saliphagus sp. LR7]|uniref:MarR family transcriptional regulator n=1 Tax=Saliphagus sp. LR7 TaxID=2282654 RepID=UPI000DF7B3F0|nr:MarR family transcriptional regulator [Saliphagus sp. LR7]